MPGFRAVASELNNVTIGDRIDAAIEATGGNDAVSVGRDRVDRRRLRDVVKLYVLANIRPRVAALIDNGNIKSSIEKVVRH